MLGILYSVLINGMVRPPNDGVHLETPQAQTTEAFKRSTVSAFICQQVNLSEIESENNARTILKSCMTGDYMFSPAVIERSSCLSGQIFDLTAVYMYAPTMYAEATGYGMLPLPPHLLAVRQW